MLKETEEFLWGKVLYYCRWIFQIGPQEYNQGMLQIYPSLANQIYTWPFNQQFESTLANGTLSHLLEEEQTLVKHDMR